MGCGASALDPSAANGSQPHIKATENGQTTTTENGLKNDSSQHNAIKDSNISGDDKGNLTKDAVSTKGQGKENTDETDKDPKGKPPPVPKSVAFQINLQDNNNVNNILSKHPPKRLKRLDPIDNAPKLSAEQLQEKIRLAEEKREKELDKKRQVSRRTSRLRNDIQQARDFDKVQQSQREEIEEKQRSAGKNREARRQEIESRKRMREERARRARDRAKKIQTEGEELEFDIEKDEGFNNDDSDSWLGDDDDAATMNTDLTSDFGSRVNSGSERIYSGRESPKKSFNPNAPDLNARMASAGTTDSFDYAFQRQPSANKSAPRDDFFDT